jgi:hypothetical protein
MIQRPLACAERFDRIAPVPAQLSRDQLAAPADASKRVGNSNEAELLPHRHDEAKTETKVTRRIKQSPPKKRSRQAPFSLV